MRRRDHLLVLLSVLTCLGAIPSSALGAGAQESLSVLGQSELVVKAKPGKDTASAYLTLLNSSKVPAPIAVSFEAASNAAVIVSRISPTSVPAAKAVRVKVTLTGLEKLTDPVEGVAVIAGGGLPVSRSVTITPATQPAAPWPEILAIGCFGAMAILAMCIVGKAHRDHRLSALAKHAPGPKWSFESWATTTTAIGAVLGTVLGAATLPTVPRQIDKDTFVRLNLLFGALVVVGPFVFQAIRRPGSSSAHQDAGMWGYNWSLLLACSITCGAVLGEIGTLALLAWELIGDHAWGWIAVAVLALTGALAAYYFAITAWSLAMTDWEAEAEQEPTHKLEARIRQYRSFRHLADIPSESGSTSFQYYARGRVDAEDLASAGPAGQIRAQRTWSLP
jgi:hypothetical protein